jgi:quinol-cytochrome oxidoreductase complex cytochrome b subunit
MLPVYAGGGRAVFLMLVLTATGILEVFHYIPTPDQAAQSIQTLTFLWINCKAG